MLFDRDDEEDTSGSCSSLVEALAAARDKEAAEKAAEKSPDKAEKGAEKSKQKPRRNSLFSINLFQKKENEEAVMAENGKPKLRLTTSHTLSSTSGTSNVPPAPATAAPVPEMKVFVTEGSLSSMSPPTSETDQLVKASEQKKESLTVDDPLSSVSTASMLHKGPRRESASFVRKMSKKIRNMAGKESETGNSSDDDVVEGARVSRQTSKKVDKVKVPRFEVIDLSMDDVPLHPPTKKLCYAQLAGMCALLCCFV